MQKTQTLHLIIDVGNEEYLCTIFGAYLIAQRLSIFKSWFHHLCCFNSFMIIDLWLSIVRCAHVYKFIPALNGNGFGLVWNPSLFVNSVHTLVFVPYLSETVLFMVLFPLLFCHHSVIADYTVMASVLQNQLLPSGRRHFLFFQESSESRFYRLCCTRALCT